MIGSFLTRGLVMIFGYAYPAYQCYKTVEKNKPEIDQLRFWCQYWILVAVLTVFERIGDTFISWVPMYSEAKLAFFIYLWYPKTRGTTYVYDSFFKPYLAKHEMEIDRNMLELRARAGDIAVLYLRQAISYGQTRIFEILQFVSAQSTSRPLPTQQQGAEATEPPPTVPTHQPASTSRSKPQQPPSNASNAGIATQQACTLTAGATIQEQHQTAEEADSAAAAASLTQPPPSPAATHPPATVADKLTKESTSKSMPSLAEAMQIDQSSTSSSGENKNPPRRRQSRRKPTVPNAAG